MNVLVVSVTFHPDLAVLQQQLAALAMGSVPNPKVLLVDNGSDSETLRVLHQWAETSPQLTLMALGENRGLAAAHNAGIAYARAHGFTHVLLMDQDSLPASHMLARLTEAFTQLTRTHAQVAAVGPWYLDPVLNNPPDFLRLRWWGISRYTPEASPPIVAVDYLISSGSLISLQALAAIGGMQEALFIDYVDIEWGLRARRLGWTLHGVFPARMTHSLGPRVARFLWRRFPLHNPQRHYFVVRNALWLYRDGGLPLSWRVPHALRLMARFSIYLLVGDSRLERLKYVWRGLCDGLRGRMGKPAWLV
jgi:rhamnosyltransferase